VLARLNYPRQNEPELMIISKAPHLLWCGDYIAVRWTAVALTEALLFNELKDKGIDNIRRVLCHT
jgi:hypothetical protein